MKRISNNASASKSTATPSIKPNEQLVYAINELCEATYSLQFIEGLFRETDAFTLAKPANWGLANILESVRARLDDAMSKLIEIEGACENE